MVSEVKLCSGCETVKNLEECFYKAGKSWQKLCKQCHNGCRSKYKNSNKPYTPRDKGWLKLPIDLREKIIYDKHVRINFKDIFNKYKDEYPTLKYQTLLIFNRKGQIPEYKDEPEEE